MKEKLLITGKGNIGIRLAHLLENKYEVYFLSRTKTKNSFVWDIEKNYIDPEAFANTEHIIHLAGAGIAEKRWTKKRQREIVASRVNSGNLLLQKIQEQNIPLKTFISASAIGYYGTQPHKVFIEKDLPSNDFLSSVCIAWEQIAKNFQDIGIRSVILRLGIVLSKDFGALPKMLQTKNFFFAPLGNGKQNMAWVHEEDVCRAFLFALENNLHGAYNIVTPNILSNASFTKLLAKLYHKPYIHLGIPSFLLKIILGKRTMLLTKGVKVSSEKIESTGFRFQYYNIEKTLQQTLFY